MPSRRDAEPGVRALRHPVERNEDADTAFPYEKGETMLAGFEAWIGVEFPRCALRCVRTFATIATAS